MVFSRSSSCESNDQNIRVAKIVLAIKGTDRFFSRVGLPRTAIPSRRLANFRLHDDMNMISHHAPSQKVVAPADRELKPQPPALRCQAFASSRIRNPHPVVIDASK